VSRRRPVLVALVTLLALAGCATTPSTRVEDTKQMRTLQARSAYEGGVAALGQEQVGLALTSFQDATTLDPTVALYADAMGVVLLHMRQVEAAIAWLNRAVELDPTYGDAHFHRATALAEAGRWDEAIAGYRRALMLPTLTVPHAAHQNLGFALFALKRYREAEQSLRFALSIESQEPQMARTYLNLGLVLLAEQRKDEARAAFLRARDLAPGSPSARDASEQLKALGDGR
jgi:Tfp pilus assembly protein PilF